MATQQNPAYYLNENLHEVGRGFRVNIKRSWGKRGVCACVNMINIHTYIQCTHTHTYIYISQSIAKNILKNLHGYMEKSIKFLPFSVYLSYSFGSKFSSLLRFF